MTTINQTNQKEELNELVKEVVEAEKQLRENEWALKNAAQWVEDDKQRVSEAKYELAKFRRENNIKSPF